MRVLVVEDSPINQNVVRKMLARLGHEADFADNGQEALNFLQAQPYQLVLMDCEMPDIDGYTVVKNYRAYAAQYGLPHTPIIALSAHSLPEHQEKAKAAGMDDYLTKPLRLEQLKQLLAHWVGKTDDSNIASAFDLTQLENLLGEEEARLILAAFIDYAPSQLAEIKSLYSDDNAEQLSKKAHQFKGESIQVGAEQLGELCRQLELDGRENNLTKALVQIRLIENELSNVLRAMQSVIEQNGQT